MVRNADRGHYRHSPVSQRDAYRYEAPARQGYTARATHPEYLLLNPETDTPYFDKRTDREVTRAAQRTSEAWTPVAQYMVSFFIFSAYDLDSRSHTYYCYWYFYHYSGDDKKN